VSGQAYTYSCRNTFTGCFRNNKRSSRPPSLPAKRQPKGPAASPATQHAAEASSSAASPGVVDIREDDDVPVGGSDQDALGHVHDDGSELESDHDAGLAPYIRRYDLECIADACNEESCTALFTQV